MARAAKRRHDEHGQSMVETVIVLPVILLLFLGLWYFKDIVDTRIRAVEAARYLTWQSVWNAREARPKRAMKDKNALRQELQQLGLGRNLVSVEIKPRKSMGDYSSATTGRDGFVELPQFIGNFFKSPEKKSTGSSNAPGTNNVPDESSVSGVIGDLLKLAGGLAFGLSDIIAKMTLWEDEANGAVFSVFVTYEVKGTSVFRFLGNTQISQKGSILAHPYNVWRKGDLDEYNRVFGEGGIGDCFSDSGKGHIFGLWFAPAVPIPGLGTGIDIGKCTFASIGSLLGFGSSGGDKSVGAIEKFFTGNLSFKMPEGTLKEYPEKNLP